jgi:hypothetical protein
LRRGHHSYGFASIEQIVFEFFDGVLAGLPDPDVASVQFTAGSTMAVVTDSLNRQTPVALAAAPVASGGTLMVGLADLATVYGPNFHAYNVYAYNTDPTKVASVVAVKYNKVMVNIKPGETFMRIGGDIRVGDTRTANTKVKAGDPDIDPKTALAVAPFASGADVFVPVVEFMALFGKTAVAN